MAVRPPTRAGRSPAGPRAWASTTRAAARPRRSGSGSAACRWRRSSAARCSAARRRRSILADALGALEVDTVQDLGECRYGAWTGGALKDLAQDPLWRVVQDHPSAARFPDSEEFPGESIAEMQLRAVRAIRATDAAVARDHGPDALWVAVSHGDVIKSVIADAAGAHLDQFQRIMVDPASLSVVRYTERRPFVVRVNDAGIDLAGLVPPPPQPDTAGGRTGPATVSRRRAGRAAARTPYRMSTRRATHRWVAAPGPPTKVEVMPVIDFDPPDRFVAGTVGPPGQRTFFLQASEGPRVTSVSLEKQQVVVLADRVNDLLDDFAGGDATEDVAVEVEDNAPLDTPIEDEFRVGTMSLGWDAERPGRHPGVPRRRGRRRARRRGRPRDRRGGGRRRRPHHLPRRHRPQHGPGVRPPLHPARPGRAARPARSAVAPWTRRGTSARARTATSADRDPAALDRGRGRGAAGAADPRRAGDRGTAGRRLQPGPAGAPGARRGRDPGHVQADPR